MQPKEVQATKILRWLSQTKKRVNLLVGGAGSGKSYATAQWLIQRAYNQPNTSILVTRKTLPSLKMTCYKLILMLLNEYDKPYELNKSELIITLPNRSEFLFKSMDEPEKIKSAEFDIIWIEEATEFKDNDYNMANLRLRRNKSLPNQMFLSCNPVSKLSWVYKNLVESQNEDVAIHRSTYRDNPFNSQEYIDYLNSLISIDHNLYLIYCLGEWGILENLIYTNWEPVDSTPEHPDEIVYGLDFGFNDPTALVEVSVKDNMFYVKELLYESKLTNKELIDWMISHISNHETPIYADSAEPARIQDIFDAGFNVLPAVKHADTITKKGVTDGIDFVKTKQLYITKDSLNILKEINSYKWMEDKDGNILDKPVGLNQHSMDALRYALVSHFRLMGGTTSFHLE